MENKFTWGDSVVIAESAPTRFHPGEFASVCGFYQIASKNSAKEFECNVKDWIYTVEFGDGSDIQIAELYLNNDPDRLKYSWGDVVVLKKQSSESFNKDEAAVVSGFCRITQQNLSEKFNKKIGDWLYIIKFENGKEMLISEECIENN